MEGLTDVGVDWADIDKIYDTIEGKELCKGKYKVGCLLDKGQHGKVFETIDNANETQSLVIKV